MDHHGISRVRNQLLRSGYGIIPTRGKRPVATGWNALDYVSRHLRDSGKGTVVEKVSRWLSRFPDAWSTGIRIENGLLVLDFDINDSWMIETLMAALREIAPLVADAPMRFGGGDKLALFARLSGDGFVRLGSRKYRRPDDPDGAYHQLEVFGGQPLRSGVCSRQFVVDGPREYADDGKVLSSYSWANGPTLLDTPLEALPEITKAQCLAVMDVFELAAEAHGWSRIEDAGEGGGGDGLGVDHYDMAPDTVFDIWQGPGGLSYTELSYLLFTRRDLRVSPLCIPGVVDTTRPDRCTVFWSNRHDCIVIKDWKDGDRHYPVELKPADLTGFGARLAEVIAEHRKKDGGDHFFTPAVSPEDFYAYMAEHKYIYIPLGTLWPAPSINARMGRIGGLKASLWLDQNRPVEQMTWAPGEPIEICDKLVSNGGWIAKPGARGFNLYRPAIIRGKAAAIGMWRDHLEQVYPDEATEIELWCAHRAQRPEVKLNHALVLGGKQGIGKDTLLEPLKHAVGPWNFHEVGPKQLLGRFNGFLKAVVLRISEARDLGEFDRFAFYDATKSIIAAPPDVLPIDEKNRQEYYIPNLCGVTITLNEMNSLYLPGDDRRHFVAWSELNKLSFDEDYWNRIWSWYLRGGLDAVAHHLMTVKLSGFDAKRPPRQTPWFHDIVNLSRASEDADMADALDKLGRPDAVTIADVVEIVREVSGKDDEFLAYLKNSRNRRKLGYRFEECGYVSTRNHDAKDGLWPIGGKRQVVYSRAELAQRERLTAAQVRMSENVVDFQKKLRERILALKNAPKGTGV